MVATQPDQPQPLAMTEAEYLAFEEQSEIKHEYAAGYVYAMTGASLAHTLICQNTATSLANQLADTPCLVVAHDLRLKVQARVAFRYPDVMVICDEPQFVENRVDTITNPQVIVEVLSASTALVDRNEKLDEYTRIASVQEYMLISQQEMKIERYARQSSDRWLYEKVIGLTGSIDLPSIRRVLELSQIYNKVNLKSSDNK